MQAEIARLEGCLAAKQAECQRLQAEGADQRQQTAAVVMEKEALQREQGRLQEQLADTKKQVTLLLLLWPTGLNYGRIRI